MTLRTPRRRISPRTKRRYRAIKDFLRRAIGSTSQPDIKINSSIAVNVTNLKHQIVGIERQLNEVSKHLICTECTCTNDSSSSIGRDKAIGTETIFLKPDTSTERSSRESKTKLLFKTLRDRKSDDSDLLEKPESDRYESKHDYTQIKARPKPKKSKHRQNAEVDEYPPYYGKHKSKSAYGRFSSTYSTNSYHSLIEPRHERILRTAYDEHHDTRHTSGCDRHRNHERLENQKHISHNNPKVVSTKRIVRNEDKHEKRRKDKFPQDNCELDPDFINNIIKRQYRPVKMFGRRESDLSQFSAPICRDQEFKVKENILEGSDLCSCCYADRKPRIFPYNEINDMRSICDTRLYSSKRNARHKTYRRQSNHYNYNDSAMYDVVPVREKSSPKSRRKFIEDLMYDSHYKEVPPSPRTLRPRLNLTSQHYSNMDLDEDDYYNCRKYSPNRNSTRHNHIDSYSNKSLSMINEKISYNAKTNKQENVPQIIGTTSYRESLPSPQLNNNATNPELAQPTNTTINKSQDIESTTDKTDKALCEIKDILQHFLQEIKKESVSIESSGKNERNPSAEMKQNNIKINTTLEEPSSHSDTNNCGMSPFPIPPSYLNPQYLNPCCYPVFPTYPINCMQNSYVVPSPSCTCPCTNKLEQATSTNKDNVTNIKKTTNNTETDKLIKEIYNLVTKSPQTTRKKDEKPLTSCKKVPEKMKAVVTRSVGDSIRITRHDAKVGTPKLKYYSKSCEAIGSALEEEHTARTTASYSDTILGKLSMDATAADSTSTETEISTELTITQKKDQGRLSKVLRSIGLLKKKKEVIEEEEDDSDSESSAEVEIRKKRKRPEFPQEIINYAMHGQEYFHLPPMPPPHLHPEYLAHQQNLLHHHYSPYPGYPGTLIQPTAPPCPCASPHADPQYLHSLHHKQPDVPLCLKEIEVKSTATQSDRKLPFFGKFGKRKSQVMPPLMQHNSMPPPKNCSTQTAQNKPGFWQKLNTPKPMTESDPRMFSFKKQKELASGDAKIKNAMLKKLFHKRNPFSPNNLIVKTLMGRDPSSFGEPPVMYRPRMFL